MSNLFYVTFYICDVIDSIDLILLLQRIFCLQRFQNNVEFLMEQLRFDDTSWKLRVFSFKNFKITLH